MTNKNDTSKAEQKKAHEKRGRRAEFWAAIYLRCKGYRILERRFKSRGGEIDIIAYKNNLIAIVEVKARSNLDVARESVTRSSRKRIESAARHYLNLHPQSYQMELRYDAIFILPGWRIIHEPAFWT